MRVFKNVVSYGIKLGLDKGTYLGSLVIFYGKYKDGNLDSSSDGISLWIENGTIMVSSDGAVDKLKIGLDEETDLVFVVGSSEGSKYINVYVSLVIISLVQEEKYVVGSSDEDADRHKLRSDEWTYMCYLVGC